MFHYRGKPKQNWQLCFPLSIFHLFIIWSVYISFIMWLFFLILVFLTVYFLLFLDFKQLLWSNNYCSRTKQCLSDYFKNYFEVCYYSFVTFILWFFMRQRQYHYFLQKKKKKKCICESLESSLFLWWIQRILALILTRQQLGYCKYMKNLAESFCWTFWCYQMSNIYYFFLFSFNDK